MRVGISGSATDDGKSGVGMYIRQMVEWLPRVGPEHEYELIADRAGLEFLAPPRGMGTVEVSPRATGAVANILWHQLELPRIAARREYDVLFLPAANRRLPFGAPCPTVGTVHDLASFHVRGKYDPWRDAYVRHVLPHLIRRLTRIITVSRAACEDVVRFCAVDRDRVEVVHNGIDLGRYTPGDAGAAREALRPLGIDRPFLLYVSRIEHPGKNHAGLIDAFAALEGNGPSRLLVFAGADRERADEVHARARASGRAADIRFLGFVPDELLPDLYRAADALVFPSHHEGFGIPIIEAMACGTPVLCARAASLPEVAGDAADYFDPRSPGSIADAIRRVCTDARYQSELSRAGMRRAAQFTLETTAARTLDQIERAGARALSQATPSSLSFSRRTL